MSDDRRHGSAGTPTVTETNLAEAMVASVRRGVRVVVSPDRSVEGRVFEVDSRLVIGRDVAPAEGISIADSRMSGRHLAITRPNERLPIFEVRDLDSKNGTFVGGHKVTSRYVEDGAVVRAGGTVLVFGQIADEPRTLEPPFFGVSTALAFVLEQADRVAGQDMTVLIEGESGVGKELVAQRIHERSGRAGPLVPVNASTLPFNLMESQLFGHRKGAFTGADQTQVGFFQVATEGTLFLDEIGELPVELQPKLLRVLETRQFTPLGTTSLLRTGARLLAATNRDLSAQVRAGTFRLDLLARLAQFRIRVPPLRERREDILPIARHLLSLEAPTRAFELTADAVETLLLYDWPMNVRELHNALRRLVMLQTGDDVVRLPPLLNELWSPPEPGDRPAVADGPTLPPPRRSSRPPDRETLESMLREAAGNVAQVAKALGKDRKQVYRWLEKAGLDPEAYRA